MALSDCLLIAVITSLIMMGVAILIGPLSWISLFFVALLFSACYMIAYNYENQKGARK